MVEGILAFWRMGVAEGIVVFFLAGICWLVPLVLIAWLIISISKIKADNKELRVGIERLVNKLDGPGHGIEDSGQQ